MKTTLAILALLVAVAGYSQPFPAPPSVVFSSKDTNNRISVLVPGPGNQKGTYVTPTLADFFKDVVFSVSSNDFNVVDGTLYSKGLAGGGTYTVTNINLNPFFAANPAFYTTNNRVLLASVPSFYRGIINGGFDYDSGISPPSIPVVQISKDGGASWFNATSTNVPVLVSLYSTSGHHSGATNLTVTAFVNAEKQGTTNDVTGQTLLVSQTADSRSVVNVTGAGQIAATAASQWANSSAVATVNFGGHDLQASSEWRVTFTNSAVAWKYLGSDVLKLSGPILSNTPPAFLSISKAGTNMTFVIQSLQIPTVQWSPRLESPSWSDLPSQVANYVNSSWTVTGPAPAATNAFFRCYVSGLASAPATLTMNGIIKGDGSGITFTNAAGKKFSIVVNTSTNGFTFVAQP